MSSTELIVDANRTLSRRDAALWFDRHGKGPIALMLHAGGERRGVWRKVMAPLAVRGLAAIAYDQRGHGDSGGSRAAPLPLLAEDAVAMIEKLTMPVVVGASLGGYAAMSALFDSNVQAKVAGLVLVDVLPDPDPSAVRKFLGDMIDPDRARQVDDILNRATELRACAELLKLPVLVVRAALNTPLQNEDAQRFLQLVPHARFAVVAGSGHLVARDKPIELAELIGDFMQEDCVRDRRIAALLNASGADSVPHPGGTLAKHLHRTADLLRSWGANNSLVDAGRLHAAFGTDGFSSALIGASGEIEDAVGCEAETIISMYGRCDRSRSYPTWGTDAPVVIDRHDSTATRLSSEMQSWLMELTVANELDVVEHSPELAARFEGPLYEMFKRWRPFLSDRCKAFIGQRSSRREARNVHN